ncbi:unnamed protein product [Sphagnum jensenii]|uniref:RNA methyltransferase n=1 Tax=Sphagnum jensenii TaxID=128206 RepID=A0ABP0VDI5_9BRYO
MDIAETDQTTGSYHNYYKRNVLGLERIDLLEENWFRNRKCLDIGCNEGKLTALIAEKYQPTSVLGIDVDRVLIEAANSIIKRANFSLASKQLSQPTSSSSSSSSPFIPMSVLKKKLLPTPSSSFSLPSTSAFPRNLRFECADIFAYHSSPMASTFDTILCLSVSKWIHLNLGDEGLLRFFRTLFDLCSSGGLLVFEFQTWKSYLNKKKVNEHIKQVFPTIQIRPEMFEGILTNKIGFTVMDRRGATVTEAKGYHRPILILQKVERSPVHISTTRTTAAVSGFNNMFEDDCCLLFQLSMTWVHLKTMRQWSRLHHCANAYDWIST